MACSVSIRSLLVCIDFLQPFPNAYLLCFFTASSGNEYMFSWNTLEILLISKDPSFLLHGMASFAVTQRCCQDFHQVIMLCLVYRVDSFTLNNVMHKFNISIDVNSNIFFTLSCLKPKIIIRNAQKIVRQENKRNIIMS